MPDPALQAYLASKYLSGPKADAILARHQSDSSDGGVKKKRKKRRTDDAHGPSAAASSSSSSATFKLKDEDDESWKRSGAASDDEGAAGPEITKGPRNDGAFKKARMMALDKDGNRVVVGEEVEVGEDAPQMATQDGSGMEEGQRIRLQEELEAQARRAADGDAEEDKPKKKPKAGLKTKEEVRAERLAREEAKRREVESGIVANQEDKDKDSSRTHGQEAETVYRDASGRRIDIVAEEEELKRQAREVEAKERERKEWTKGQVQRQEAERRAKELKDIEKEGVARYATDKSYNDTLRKLERGDDPALAFLTKKREKGAQKPKYKGPPPPPNRFGIQPGYRWDGVDRGNGFEKMLFQKRNERSRREAQSHAWDMEDL